MPLRVMKLQLSSFKHRYVETVKKTRSHDVLDVRFHEKTNVGVCLSQHPSCRMMNWCHSHMITLARTNCSWIGLMKGVASCAVIATLENMESWDSRSSAKYTLIRFILARKVIKIQR
jgi:hypothetical protein